VAPGWFAENEISPLGGIVLSPGGASMLTRKGVPCSPIICPDRARAGLLRGRAGAGLLRGRARAGLLRGRARIGLLRARARIGLLRGRGRCLRECGEDENAAQQAGLRATSDRPLGHDSPMARARRPGLAGRGLKNMQESGEVADASAFTQ
jgi:hypothetical protein